MRQIRKDQLWNYLLLSARVLLAWTLARYGWAKLTDAQFGVNSETMNLPLKDVDLFKLSWYLADHQPFKSFVGVSQLITSLLLIIDRTAIVGAFVSIPIWLNILVWDITFMKGMTAAFTFRLSYYLILTGLIIYQQKHKVIPALRSTIGIRNSPNYPIWIYFTLPIAAIFIEIVGALPNAALSLLKF